MKFHELAMQFTLGAINGEKGGGVSAIKWELGDVKIARCYVSNTRKYKKNKVNYKVGSYSLHHILI